MSTTAFLASFTAAYILAMMALSWWAGKKFVTSEGEFMIGARQFNTFLTMVGLTAILISGGYLPGIVLYGYLFGVGGAWFYIGWITGALVTLLLWAGFWRVSGAYTPTEWFEYRYGRVGRLAISFIIIIAVLAIVGWQFVGSGATMAGALNITTTQAILIIGAAVIIYVALGGVWAATLTDLVQWAWVMVVAFLAVPIYLFVQYGFPTSADLPEGSLSLPFGTMPVLQLTLPSVITFVILHQALLNQAPYFTRAAGARSRRTVNMAWGLSLLIALVTGVAGSLVGMYARMLVPDLESPDLAFGSVLEFLPAWLAALALAGLLAATMSTVDIYLVSGVNQFVRDVVQDLLRIRDSRQLLRVARWVTLIYGAVTVAFAVFWTSGLGTLFGFGTAIGAPLFIFYLDSWLLKVGNGPGAVASVVASLVTVLVWDRLTDLHTIVHTLWVVFPVALIVLVVASLLFRGLVAPAEVAPEREELSSTEKGIMEAAAKGYTSAADIVDYCGARQELGIQLPQFLREIDRLVERGYLRRRGSRLTNQLYFELTPEGNNILSEAVDSEDMETLQTHGFGSDALAVLDTVRETPGVTALDLAQNLGVSVEVVSPVINQLERKELVDTRGLISPRVYPTNNTEPSSGRDVG